MKNPASSHVPGSLSRRIVVFLLLVVCGSDVLASPDVKDATIESKTGSTSLTVAFNKKVVYQLARVRGTNLMYLDIDRLQVEPTLSALADQVKSNDPVLKKIRVSNFSEKTARLVFHLKTDIKRPVVQAFSSKNGASHTLVINFVPTALLRPRNEEIDSKSQVVAPDTNKPIISADTTAATVAAVPATAATDKGEGKPGTSVARKAPDNSATVVDKTEPAHKLAQTPALPVDAHKRAAEAVAAEPVKSEVLAESAHSGGHPSDVSSVTHPPAGVAVTQIKPATPLPGNSMPGAVQKQVSATSPVLDALRWTILSVHQGNLTGDYSPLYARLSAAIQSKIRPEQLAQALKGFRERKIDLSDVANLEPVFFRTPWKDAHGLLSVNGYFSTKPQAVRFAMGFKPVADGWRIEALNLDMPSAEELATSLKNGQAARTAPKQAQSANGAPSKAGTTAMNATPSVPASGAAAVAPPPDARMASGAAGAPAPAKVADTTTATSPKPQEFHKGGQPRNPMVDLLRSTLLFTHAGNVSGDYGQLYSRLSRRAQDKLTPEQLGQALKEFRDRKIDLSAVTNLEPVFLRAPWQDAQGMTNLNGYFPSKPHAIHFAIALTPVAQSWEIEAMKLDIPGADELAAKARTASTMPTQANAKGGVPTSSTPAPAASSGRPSALPATKLADENGSGNRSSVRTGLSKDTVAEAVRATLIAANRGNLSGDYSQLYARLSPSVQGKIRPDQLAQALKGFRDRKIDLSDVANLEPAFFNKPWEDPQGTLNVNGYFPTKPQAVRFSIGLKLLADGWRVEALNLDTPNADELALLKRNGPVAGVAPKAEPGAAKAEPAASQPEQTEAKAERTAVKPAVTRNFESVHLDWSTDPPTASKW